MTRERYNVLVWNGKYEPIYYGPITNDEERDAAYLQVFKDLDEWGVYYDYAPEAECPDYMNLADWEYERELYKMALDGHGGAAMNLIGGRSDHEYESVYESPLHKVGDAS